MLLTKTKIKRVISKIKREGGKCCRRAYKEVEKDNVMFGVEERDLENQKTKKLRCKKEFVLA